MGTRSGPRAVMAAAIVILAGLVGCTSGSSSTSASSMVAEAPTGDDAGGSGTAIAEGLDVQPGSHLLGTVFPDPHSPPRSGVRVALVRVEDDPVQVVDHYMRALTDLGYRFASSGCGDDGDVGPDVVCETPADPAAAGDGAAAMWFASPADGSARFTTMIQLAIGPRDARADPSAGPAGDSTTVPRPPGTIITAAQAIDDVGGVSAVTADPPAVGEPIAGSSFDGGTGLVVEPGSEFLAPAVPVNAGRAGWSAVARVTGDPLAVADAYLDQRTWDSTSPATRDDTDGPRITASASVPHDVDLDLLLIPVGDDPDGDWWILLTVTID